SRRTWPQRSGGGTANGTSRMGRTPRRRSSSAGTTSSTSRISTRRSIGLPAALPHRAAASRSDRTCPCERSTPDVDGHQAVEFTAGTSYGRLVAFLTSRWRDVARAEDALGNALLSALLTWPQIGVPANPEAWLLTAARRDLIDVARHASVESAAAADLLM